MRVQRLPRKGEMSLAQCLVLGGVRVDHHGDILGVCFPAHDELRLSDQFPDTLANQVNPDDGTVHQSNQVCVPLRAQDLALPVATQIVGQSPNRVGAVSLLSLRRGEPDRGHLGDAVGDAGHLLVQDRLRGQAGDQFAVVENEARAREITDYRVRKRRETLGSAGSKSTLEQMMAQLKEAGRKEFPLVIKGDVQGSVEAITGQLKKIGNDEVEARIVHTGVGGITESDIALAGASKAVVIGFNVRANEQAKRAADQQGIEIRYYNIIYDLVDEVKAAMSGLLAPTKREVFLGYATIKQVFNISKVGKVAGCQVTQGKVERGAKVRLLRDNVVIHEGSLSILKRFKDDVKEVPAGQECGMAFESYKDMREGDVIECFNVEVVQRSL